MANWDILILLISSLLFYCLALEFGTTSTDAVIAAKENQLSSELPIKPPAKKGEIPRPGQGKGDAEAISSIEGCQS